MRIGIDASSLRRGGGLTHLVELLNVADPSVHEFEGIAIWGGRNTLDRLPKADWLVKHHHPWLDRSILYRILWKRFVFPRIDQSAMDILFVPGGLYSGNFNPRVAMSQNMLPFEKNEMSRYGISYEFARNWLLKSGQIRDFNSADGLIFLTKYAERYILQYLSGRAKPTATIPHGIDPIFLRPPKKQIAIERYSNDRPFKILYVSIIDVYKHQWNVIDAVGRLRSTCLPVELILVGPSYGPALKKMKAAIENIAGARTFVKYLGEKSKAELVDLYHSADMFVFASSCENLPNIMIEAMAAGLPIASSDRGPMPEVLGDAGVYFDPESPESIEAALRAMIVDADKRAKLASKANCEAQDFSWRRCADKTFSFLRDVYARSEKSKTSIASR